MKEHIPLLVLLAQTFVSMAATAVPSGTTNSVVSGSVETNGYRFTVTCTNSTVGIGERLVLTTVLKNTTSSNVTIVVSQPTIDLVKVSKQGKGLQPTEFANSMQGNVISSSKRPLRPNEQIAQSVPVGQLYDMSSVGEYQVTISTWVRVNNDTAWGTITAPTIVVTVKEHQP